MSTMVDGFVGFEREEEGKIDFGGRGKPWMTVKFFFFFLEKLDFDCVFEFIVLFVKCSRGIFGFSFIPTPY